jgi:hypothetical protein
MSISSEKFCDQLIHVTNKHTMVAAAMLIDQVDNVETKGCPGAMPAQPD